MYVNIHVYICVYIHCYICIHIYVYTYMYIYTYLSHYIIVIYIYIYISADLFQSSSVLDYSCNPQCLPIQHPRSLPILTHLEASEHPSIPDCRNPLFDHLKGLQVPPAGLFRMANLEPPHAPFCLPGPLNRCSRLHRSAK